MTIRPSLRPSTRIPLLGALLMLTPALALGQGPLPKDQQICINELNKGFAKVAKKQAKEVCTCIKDGAQGKLGEQTIEECTTADNKGKVAAAKQKTIDKAADKCTGPAPPFGATDATTVNAAAMAKEILLIHELFGADLDEKIIPKADKAAHKCQVDVAKAAKKCQDTKLKQYNKCKKDGLKGKVPPGLITSAADLETNCLMTGDDPNTPQPDAKGTIAKACVTKLGAKISQKCSGVNQAMAFSGPCFDASNLQACLDTLVECRVCLAINAADDLNRDCDRFDDGLANVSCPPILPVCGDGTLQAPLGEECDDGNTDDGDGCNGVCLDEFCGDGIVNDAPNEACDDGNTIDGDCCSSSCQIESAATECRAAPDVCDVAENCDGITPTCPADDVVAVGTECRASAGVCDVADNCTGSDPNCPADAKSTAECRAATAACDAPEVCDGVTNDCPADLLEPASTECRASAGVCDVADNCTGSDPSCPADAFDTGTECRASMGVCDPAESCNGTGPSCPADVFEPGSTECRADVGQCDVAESCTGSDPDCPPDATEPDGTGCSDGDACTGPDECMSGVCLGDPACGNGSTEGACGEECDDGNTVSFDDCSDSCLAEIGSHKCVLDDPNEPIGFCAGGSNNGLPCTGFADCPGGVCRPVSGLIISTAVFPLTAFLTGSVDIACSAVDPNTGKAACQCILQDLSPFEISGIGFICISPSDPNNPCDLGEIDCDGGNGLDVDLMSDHNIGACTGNPDCDSQCVTHCAGLGTAVFDAACGGFCEGGSSAGSPCTTDAGCPGGACNGKDALPHGNVCACSCIEIGGAASAAGGLQCNAGASILVEIGAPCDGSDVLIVIGTQCIPLTTEVASSIIDNANNSSGAELPPGGLSASGVAAVCNDLVVSTTTDIVLAGAVNFFDSTIGDLAVELIFTCR